MSHLAMPVRINATEVASLAGVHPYKSPEYTLCVLWCRNAGSSFRAAVKRLSETAAGRGRLAAVLGDIERKAKTASTRVVAKPTAATEQHPRRPRIYVYGNKRVARLFVRAQDQLAAGVASATPAVEAAPAPAQPPTAPAQPPTAPAQADADNCESLLVTSIVQAMQSEHGEVKEHVHDIKRLVSDSKELELIVGNVYKYRGLAQEDGSEALYQDVTQTKVGCRQQAYEMDIEGLHISGRLDAVKEDGSFVEWKNRQHRFFDRLPEQETCQLQTYMVLTGTDSCELVQRFRGEQRITPVERDDTYWYRFVLPRMQRQVQRLEQALATDDGETQRQLLEGAQKSLQRESQIILDSF
jgi:hypothetical protein